jgi:cytoskeletal protein RodZ
MASFGLELKRTREHRRVSLDDVTRETRLSKRYLVALENEAIGKLPGGAYNRAYLKNYAVFLGLDPEPLLRDYATEEARHVQSEQDQLAAMNRAIERRGDILVGQASTGSDESPVSRRFSILAVSVATLALVAGAAWFGLSGFQRASSTVEVAGGESAPKPSPSAGTGSRTGPTRLQDTTRDAPPRPMQEGESRPAVSRADHHRAASAPLSDAVPVVRTAAFSHLALAGSGVGTNVADRQLVGKSDRFATGSRVVFWTHVRGGRRGDTIDHVWFRDGAL